ncbi:hypothetical protein MHY1_00779 [Methylovirgula sp. HY1]|nr:hypothetical protein MHY1_00779 [Methylovirgula sp. HY1]
MDTIATQFQTTTVGALKEGVNLSRLGLYTAIISGTVIHFVGLGQPLWLDEAWTGAIAAQNSISAVFHQILFDVNAPLYYVLAYFWAKIFGLSDVAMRVPSALLTAAAAWVVVAGRAPIDKETKLGWAALLALWVPGLEYAHDARCYGLLFFLATINALLFARLIMDPKRQNAYGWATVSLLLILTHYYALLLVGTQVLLLLARHRAKALSLWPALFIFAPLPFWMMLQISVILRFLDPRVAWYWLLKFGDLGIIIDFLANSYFVVIFVLLLAILGVTRRKDDPLTVEEKGDPLWLVVLASVIPAAVVIAVGFVRPSFIFRYLMPFGPGILLGLALVARNAKPVWKLAPLAMLLVFLSPTAGWLVKQIGRRGNPYSFETASQFLIQQGTRHLVFLWDNPSSQVVDPQQLAAVGGFFFKRAGVPVDVTPIKLHAGEDPNSQLLKAAKAKTSAILWLYDIRVHKTAARAYPVAIEARDPAWLCQNFGNQRIGIIACHRKNTGRG